MANGASPGGDQTKAPVEGYPMKNGGIYKPPAPKLESPAQDFGTYGRT